MRTQLFFISSCLLLITSLFLSCSDSDDPIEPELSYKEKEIIFLKEFSREVRESWRVDKMVIAKDYITSDPANDTIIINPGHIFVNNIYTDPVDPEKYNQLEAYFYINSAVIPFKSRLMGFSDRSDVEFNGVTGLMESDYHLPFPINTEDLPVEYRFLDDYFFGENYIMILSEDGKTWNWKGLNHFMREVVLTRN